jgi:hypothetical protein
MSAALASFLRTCAPPPTPVDLANWARNLVLHESGEGAGPASREDLEETARGVEFSGPPVTFPPRAIVQPSGESNAS